MDVGFESAVLERMIEPQSAGLSGELARYVLSLDFNAVDHQRMNALSASVQDGELSAEEQGELDSYLHLGHLLALLQSKARLSLQKTNGS